MTDFTKTKQILTAIQIDINKYNCIDAMFLTLADYYNRGVELMSIGSWGFDYQPNYTEKNKFGEKLFSGMTMPSRKVLSHYHGIDVDWQENVTWDELKKAIDSHIKENRPIGIYINGYDCPWNPAYRKAKVDHYCLVTSYDPETKNYNCIDSYYRHIPMHQGKSQNFIDEQLLPEENLKQGFRDYISFALKEPVSHYSLKQIFKDVQLRPEDFQKRKHVFENIAQFGRDLSQTLDINLEVEQCNGQIESTKLYRFFVQQSQRRQNYTDALRFLKENAWDVTPEMADDLETITAEFDRVAGQWTKMSVLMLKLYLTKKEMLREKMGALAEQISREELELFKKIVKIGT